MPDDSLTRMNPGIARLAEYYRNPAERRPGDTFGHRLLRIGVSLLTDSKADFQRAQLAKERLFAANVQLNQMKEAQKGAKQRLDVYTQEAMQRMQHGRATHKRAEQAFAAVRNLYGQKGLAAAGGAPEYLTPEAAKQRKSLQKYREALADQARAMAEYYRKGGKGAFDLLDIERIEKAAKERIEDINKQLTAQGKLLRDPLIQAGTPQHQRAIGEYARIASQGALELGRSQGMTVDSGVIPQAYQTAMAEVGRLGRETLVKPHRELSTQLPLVGEIGAGRYELGGTKLGLSAPTIQQALAAKLQSIQRDFVGAGPRGAVKTPWTESDDFSTAIVNTLSDILPYSGLDDFILGAGGSEQAISLFHQYYMQNPEELGL